ncbi:rCG60244 [Rattus norvegicus]|uniref:RCG60244 n=1 Tax=Rattus norvegicus TaxID=10116 RepID=A6HTE6_RAT|nr:rCG60244 [Rattus norvegicus]
MTPVLARSSSEKNMPLASKNTSCVDNYEEKWRVSAGRNRLLSSVHG